MQSVTLVGVMIAALATGLTAALGTVAAHARGTIYPKTLLVRRTLGDDKSGGLSSLLALQGSSSRAAAVAQEMNKYPPGSLGQSSSSFRTNPNPRVSIYTDNQDDQWTERLDQTSAMVQMMQAPPSNAELSDLLTNPTQSLPPTSEQPVINYQGDRTTILNTNSAVDRLQVIQQHLAPNQLENTNTNSANGQQVAVPAPEENPSSWVGDDQDAWAPAVTFSSEATPFDELEFLDENQAVNRLQMIQQHLAPNQLENTNTNSANGQQVAVPAPEEDPNDWRLDDQDDLSNMIIYDDMYTPIIEFEGPNENQAARFDSMIQSLSTGAQQVVNGGLNDARISMGLLTRILAAIQGNPLQWVTNNGARYQDIITTALQAIPKGGLSQVEYNIFFVDVLCDQLLRTATGTSRSELTAINNEVKKIVDNYKSKLITVIAEMVPIFLATNLVDNSRREFVNWSIAKAFNQSIPPWGDLMGSWMDVVDPTPEFWQKSWSGYTEDVLDMYFTIMRDGRKEIIDTFSGVSQTIPNSRL